MNTQISGSEKEAKQRTFQATLNFHRQTLVSQFEYCHLRQFPISVGRNGDIAVLIKIRLQQLGKVGKN